MSHPRVDVPASREEGFPLELERRVVPRNRCSLPARVEYEGRALPATIECFSRRGLLLRTPVEARPGSQLTLHVPEIEVRVRGRVRSRLGVSRSLDGVQCGAVGIEVGTLPHDLAAHLEGRLG